jgi:hypothetical protein
LPPIQTKGAVQSIPQRPAPEDAVQQFNVADNDNESQFRLSSKSKTKKFKKKVKKVKKSI